VVQPFRPAANTDPLLASALTDDVAARLRTIHALRVVSTQTPVDPHQAESRLAAETILNGSVDLAGGRLQVAAQLSNVKDGSVIWAEQATDLDPHDLQAAVARLASSISARLRGNLLPAERHAWNAADPSTRWPTRSSCGPEPNCCGTSRRGWKMSSGVS